MFISLTRGRINVEFPYNPILVECARSIPGGVFERRSRLWSWPLSRPNLLRVYKAFRKHGEVELSPFTLEILRSNPAYTDLTVSPPLPLFYTEPWYHQRRAFWFTVNNWGPIDSEVRAGGGVLLALDMGTGKSKIAIDLIHNYKFRRTLVICPAKVIPVWPYQFSLHSVPDKIRVLPLSGKMHTSRKAEILLRAVENQPSNQSLVVVLNYEATRPRCKILREMLIKIKWSCLILDECHRIKAPSGVDSRFFWHLGNYIPCRLGLTGTPIYNKPVDIFAQTRFLNSMCLGNSYSRFRSTYCMMGGFENKQILGYRDLDDLAKEIAPITMQINAEDVLDLPDETHIDHIVEFDQKTKELYDKFNEDLTAWVAEGIEVTAANGLVKINKLQEITGGFIRDPQSQIVTRLGKEKAEALKERLFDLPEDEPAVVFCRYSPDIEIVREMVRNCYEKGKGRVCYELSGKKNELEAWQKATGGEVLVAQISSGKEGIDLTRARYAFYYSLGFSPGEFHQSLRRLLRPGQRRHVFFIQLSVKGSVDRKIYHALKSKKEPIELILREIKNALGGEEAEKERSESNQALPRADALSHPGGTR